jgi:hypothetical protein
MCTLECYKQEIVARIRVALFCSSALEVRVAGIAIGATFYFSHKFLQHFIYTTMSGVENQVAVHDVVFPEDGTIDNLSDAMAKVSLRPDNSSSQSPESITDSLNKDKNDVHGRPFVMYSRLQLLLLHKSPLVCTPTGMPALKDWFGFVPCPIHQACDLFYL